MPSNTIKFFSYVVRENVEGIRALLGRRKLLYEDAVISGYELCTQDVGQVRDDVPAYSPIDISTRQLLLKTYKPDYELYTIRAKPGSVVPGKVWYISLEEFEYWREYELLDYGLSQDITTHATLENGDIITVQTYGLVEHPENISKVIDPSYIRESIPTKRKLAHKRQIRLNYIAMKSQANK